MLRRFLAAGVVFLSPSALFSQDVPLSQVLPGLLTRAIVTPSSRNAPQGQPGIPHEAHFLPALGQQSAAYDLNKAIVTYLSTFPIGSSSGGFTYEVDPTTGIPKRSSSNFGPSFSERALTIGKGRLSAGVNFQSVGYDRFEGLDLGQDSESEMVFYLEHNDCCLQQSADGVPRADPPTPKDPAFEGDLLRMAVGLEVKSQTAAFFANYGLTDRIDVGVAVPLVKVELDATIDARLERLSGTNPLIHTFAANQDVSSVRLGASESASGLGDVVLRTKYNFLHTTGGGLAAALDLRLPTGDEENLLGTGATQAKLYLVYSQDFGAVSPRLNVGYTLSEGDLASGVGFAVPEDTYSQNVFKGRSAPPTGDLSVPDEINYSAGLSISATPRITLSLDGLGRTIRDVNRFARTSQTFQFRTANAGPVTTATRSDGVDVTEKSNLNILLGVAGLKVNLARTVLLTASVLFPLNDAGLRAKVTPVFGLDYAF